MRATAWHNGGSPTDPGGYGIKFSESDRDAFFSKEWTDVVIEFDGDEATVALAPSFWRSCSELRSAAIGRWLLASGPAPWQPGRPPGIAVQPTTGNRFTARVLKKHNLL